MNRDISITLKWILEEFDKRNIEYAILRDYEELPNIGNDLDLVHNNNKNECIKQVLEEAVQKHYWDELKEIKKWDSYVNDFSILVFKFLDYKNKTVLNIDIFFGYSIYSAKGISGRDLVARRLKEKFYYKIHPDHEIIMRSMQLACSIEEKNFQRNIKLIDKINQLGGKKYLDDMIEDFGIVMKNKFNDVKYNEDFAKLFNYFKIKYLYSSFFDEPIITLLRFTERIRWRLKLCTFSLPGKVILINNSRDEINNIKIKLEDYKNNKIIRNFYILRIGDLRSYFIAYKTLLANGVVVCVNPFISNYNTPIFEKIIN